MYLYSKYTSVGVALSTQGLLPPWDTDVCYNIVVSGYMRELTYQHKDGSFSAFGDRDTSGSMW